MLTGKAILALSPETHAARSLAVEWFTVLYVMCILW
jgi:hypothetical protein